MGLGGYGIGGNDIRPAAHHCMGHGIRALHNLHIGCIIAHYFSSRTMVIAILGHSLAHTLQPLQ